MVSELVEENPWISPQGDNFMEARKGWQIPKRIIGCEENPRKLVDKGLIETLVYGKILRFGI